MTGSHELSVQRCGGWGETNGVQREKMKRKKNPFLLVTSSSSFTILLIRGLLIS